MRSIQIFLTLVFLFSSSWVYALVYPTGTPDATEVYGGTYYNYFTNIFSSETSCNAAGKVVGGFRSDGTPICVLPWISPGFVIPGSLTGDTLRYDGVDWVRNNLLYNNGTVIGIWNQNPQAKLDVSGDILVNGLTVGRWGWNDLMNTVLWSSALLHNINGTETLHRVPELFKIISLVVKMSQTDGQYSGQIPAEMRMSQTDMHLWIQILLVVIILLMDGEH